MLMKNLKIKISMLMNQRNAFVMLLNLNQRVSKNFVKLLNYKIFQYLYIDIVNILYILFDDFQKKLLNL